MIIEYNDEKWVVEHKTTPGQELDSGNEEMSKAMLAGNFVHRLEVRNQNTGGRYLMFEQHEDGKVIYTPPTPIGR